MLNPHGIFALCGWYHKARGKTPAAFRKEARA
jgi:hypothetical protein